MVRKSYNPRGSSKVSLPDRHGLSLVFVVAVPNAVVPIDNSEVENGFPALFRGSNTGTFGEPVWTRTTLDAAQAVLTSSSEGSSRLFLSLKITPS